MSRPSTISRLSLKGEKFEIIVAPDPALNFKLTGKGDIRKILLVDEVYSDSKKGLRVSSDKLKKFFGTTDVFKIAEKILLEGELQLTSEQRRRMIESKKQQIIAMLSKSLIDPSLGNPIPLLRIEQALNQIGVSIDPFKPPEEQFKNVVKALRQILQFKVNDISLTLTCQQEESNDVYGFVNSFGEVDQTKAQKDKSVKISARIPSILMTYFLEKINEKYGERVKVDIGA
ncbi:MAG: ribosome assembly factor SBDS [Crenarchaeota archaeon]|nr:ribosome assembly factor SBDS [Thermoproteota archaeon]MDW8033364.1 ribosome assembly factor SBDS [Nitrososphaerota archaeon]